MSTSQHRWYDVGPHGFYDLVRLARRGRSTLVRVLYVLALFAALAAVYFDMAPRYHDNINANARVAERFSITILVAQNIAVLVLMPIYIGTSVFEERDRRTLQLLFTTDLSAREIVVGKWLSRVGHVGAILLSGLPVLAFAQLWGGIDMPMIAANFWNTGLWLLSVGAFTMFVAQQSASLVGALVKTYLLLSLLLNCCCGPLEVNGAASPFLLRPPAIGGAQSYEVMWSLAGVMTFVHGGAALWFLRRAAKLLEAQRGQEPPPEVFIEPGETTPFYSVFTKRPKVGVDAIVWKERHTDRPYLFDAPIFLLPMVFWLASISLTYPSGHGRDHDQKRALQILILLSAGVFVLIVAFRLSGCIVRERQRQTLDSLLALPMTSAELLYAKLKGNLLRCWTWLVPLAMMWLCAVTFWDGYRWAAVGFLFALAVHLYFFAMLALCLSVVCRTTMTAYVSLAVIMMALLFGPLLLAEIAGLHALAPVNPVLCWVWIWEQGPFRPEHAGSLALYLLGGVVLHRLTFSLFARRE